MERGRRVTRVTSTRVDTWIGFHSYPTCTSRMAGYTRMVYKCFMNALRVFPISIPLSIPSPTHRPGTWTQGRTAVRINVYISYTSFEFENSLLHFSLAHHFRPSDQLNIPRRRRVTESHNRAKRSMTSQNSKKSEVTLGKISATQNPADQLPVLFVLPA